MRGLLFGIVVMVASIAGCSSDASDSCHVDGDCPSGQKCTDGRCYVLSSNGCPDGQAACGAICVDLAREAKNCGVCGRVCGTGLTCVNGECKMECASGLVSCGGACISTQSDTSNCGSCGNACTPGVSCQLGICVK